MFNLAANRSYDVFLLEPGTKLSLIAQRFMQPQPSITVAHNTQIFLSQTISKISEPTCQKTPNSKRMACVIDNIQSKILTTGVTCLPIQFSNVFPRLINKFPRCKNDSNLTTSVLNVRHRHFLKWYKSKRFFLTGNMAYNR